MGQNFFIIIAVLFAFAYATFQNGIMRRIIQYLFAGFAIYYVYSAITA